MTEKLGNISYTEDAALHPGAAFEEQDGLDELKTELCWWICRCSRRKRRNPRVR